MDWVPAPGDRIKTIITTAKEFEIVYLNSEESIASKFSSEFIILTGDWIPWSHQIIDFLSRQKSKNRQTVLSDLLEFEKFHTELDFDSLCLLFLQTYLVKSNSFMEESDVSNKS